VAELLARAQLEPAAPTSGGAKSQCRFTRCHGMNATASVITTHASVVTSAMPPERIVSGCPIHRMTPPTAPKP
jgi:hypothetical protein